MEPCKYCHNIYDKFNLNKSLQDSLTKEYAGKWIEQIRQILDRKRFFDIILFLNEYCFGMVKDKY